MTRTKKTGIILLFPFLFLNTIVHAQDSSKIRVHFLYGSKPKKEYKDIESKWFGGKLGGHVGIELNENEILNFIPSGSFHIIQKKERHSQFTTHTFNSFYGLFGSDPAKVKKCIISIPISAKQKVTFDSISRVYINHTPYDYAFIGKRCASAAYDILGQLNQVKPLGHTKTALKIFYPRRLRKRLLTKAKKYNWYVEQDAGTQKRKWEQD